MTVQTDHAKGLLITGIGGLFLSLDVPMIRLAAGEPWSILMLRTGSTFLAALVIWAVWRWLSPSAPRLVPGRKGLLVSALYGLGSITFVMGVYHTTTANLVFILAFTTMFAALLAWLFLGERPRPVTLWTMAVMVVGVGILVSDSLGSGNLFGDLLAAISALSIAAAITISRSSGEDMGFTALVGVFLPCLIAMAMVSRGGYSVDAPGWIVFHGAVIMPISFFCLAMGPRWISAPEVAMFYLLETVLAPIWVWLVFAEAPTGRALVGGAILVAALLAHSAWQLIGARRSRHALRAA